MAKPTLADSTAAMPPEPSLEIVYHRRDAFAGGTRFRWHAHPFWQCEVALSGRIEVRLEREDLVLEPGDWLLIPPRRGHRMDYLGPTNRYLSIKFALRDPGPPLRTGKVAATPVTRGFSGVLEALVPAGEHPPRPDGGCLARVLEAALLHLAPPALASPGGEPAAASFAARVLRQIERSEGRRPRVADLAAGLGLSPGHLASRFKRETGSNLKAKIDALAIEKACFLLTHSGHSISELANLLDFPDLYAFSRFFKARCGLSPRAYRQARRREG